MPEQSISLMFNDTVAAIIYTLLTLAFLIVPFVYIKMKKTEDDILIDKYMKVFPSKEEALEAYNRDKANYPTIEPYRKESLFAVIYYFASFYILSIFITFILEFIYLKANGFSFDVINIDSENFNEDIYNHMINFLEPIMQTLIYTVTTVGVVILMRKAFKKDLSNLSGKIFAFGAMGFGLSAAFSAGSQIVFTILGITERKPEASNQEAIMQMFNSPLAMFLMFFVIVIMAPIVEELIFRKSIFKLIKNQNLALIVSSLIFGSLHVISGTIIAATLLLQGDGTYLDVILELVFIIQYSLAGLGFGIAYIKSGKNVCSTIFSHMLNNGLSYIMMVLMILFPEFFEQVLVIVKSFI